MPGEPGDAQQQLERERAARLAQRREWEQERTLLHQTLARVAVAAQGQDSTLDAALGALRKALRDDAGADHLPVQLEALQSRIVSFDQQRSERNQQLVAQLQRLVDRVQQQSPEEAQPALRGLEKQLRRAQRQSADMSAVLGWLEQLNAIESQPGEDAGVPGGKAAGWMQRLLGRAIAQPAVEAEASKRIADERPAAPLAESEEPAESATEHDQPMSQGSVLQLVASDEGLERRPLGEELSAEVSAVLVELLAEIDIPEVVREVAAELYQDLQDGLVDSELVSVLDRTVTVVIAALGRDQNDFEQFLQHLDRRLLAVNEFLLRVDHDQAQLGEQLNDMQLVVREELDQLGTVSALQADGAELQSMRQKVEHSVAAIADSVDAFARFQGEQRLALNEQIEMLAARIAELEGEAREAQENIRQQREKLLRDVLTELPNREAYNARVEQEYERWRRYRRPLVMAIADIDYFKRINDSYGHAAGDKVLRLVGRTFKQQMRTTDFIARLGGEEFALIFPETDLASATVALDKLRAKLADCPFRFGEQPVPITASFGAAEFAADDTIAEVFERADAALYAAKEAGRNCVRCADADSR